MRAAISRVWRAFLFSLRAFRFHWTHGEDSILPDITSSRSSGDASTKKKPRSEPPRRAAISAHPGPLRNVVTVGGAVIYPLEGETPTMRGMLAAHSRALDDGLEPHLWDARGRDRH